MPAVGDQARGGGGVRLFHEARDGVHAAAHRAAGRRARYSRSRFPARWGACRRSRTARPRAATAATANARCSAAVSAIAWSAASIHSRRPGRPRPTSTAAAAMAGALLRPTGSSTRRASGMPAARNCSAIRKRCSWLQTTIGGAKPGPRARNAVSCIRVRSDISGQSCLGKLSRETGHKRVPEPPDRMTGTMRGSFMRHSVPESMAIRHRTDAAAGPARALCSARAGAALAELRRQVPPCGGVDSRGVSPACRSRSNIAGQ